MLHYIKNKSIYLIMIIPFTLFFGALGFFYYKSKDEISFLEKDDIDLKFQKEDDDLYKDIEDLFI